MYDYRYNIAKELAAIKVQDNGGYSIDYWMKIYHQAVKIHRRRERRRELKKEE